MDPAIKGGPDGIDLMQLADPRTLLHDVNIDPQPGNAGVAGNGKGSPPEPFDYRGWRKLVRNFTPS